MIAMTLLGGCGMVSSDSGVCLPMVVYSAEQQRRAAEEVEALTHRSVIYGMLADYYVLRQQARACQSYAT